MLLDNIIVATSINKSDDSIYDVCKKTIKVYRGSEENVLKEFLTQLQTIKPIY